MLGISTHCSAFDRQLGLVRIIFPFHASKLTEETMPSRAETCRTEAEINDEMIDLESVMKYSPLGADVQDFAPQNRPEAYPT